MVICSKCGFENANDSKFCAKCGQPLFPSVETPSEQRYPSYRTRRLERDMRWGISGGFWSLLIGFAIVLWGVSEIVQQYYKVNIPWWPLIVIIIGLFIIVRGLNRAK